MALLHATHTLITDNIVEVKLLQVSLASWHDGETGGGNREVFSQSNLKKKEAEFNGGALWCLRSPNWYLWNFTGTYQLKVKKKQKKTYVTSFCVHQY